MPSELIYLLRMLLASFLGFLIGMERKSRSKEAGIRTHAIVSLGACLMMIVSKYGFEDMNSSDVDASRIASQIVSGIGFLGAGMILYRRQALSGLTTAAGIWTTAGVGMAAGAGLYILSAGAAVLIVFTQFLLHLNIKPFRTKISKVIRIVFKNNAQENEIIKEVFGIKKFNKFNCEQTENGEILCTAYLTLNKNSNENDIFATMKKYDFIHSIELADDE